MKKRYLWRFLYVFYGLSLGALIGVAPMVVNILRTPEPIIATVYPIMDPVAVVTEEPVELPSGGMETAVGAFMVLPIHEEDYIKPTSPFGLRTSPFTGEPAYHGGTDLVGVWRARIVAAADGVILEHWPAPTADGRWNGHPQLGGFIKILHVDGSETWYGHMNSTYVHEGDSVKAGDVIGRQGASGIVTAAHLHFELWMAGERKNPLAYIKPELSPSPEQG